jgi:hypothetical protein
MTTTTLCANYLCENTAATPCPLCRLCRASDELTATVNAAVERYLGDRFPVSDALPELTQISDALADLRRGLTKLIEAAAGKPVGMFYSDPFNELDNRWYANLNAWDFSEHDDDDDD